MSASDFLFLAGLLGLALAGALWPSPAGSEPADSSDDAGCIDYRPQVLTARKAAS